MNSCLSSYGNVRRGNAAATAALRDTNRDFQPQQHAEAPPKPVITKAYKPPRFRFSDVSSKKERRRLFGMLPDRSLSIEDLEALREMEAVA